VIRIRITVEARQDLDQGYAFYEIQYRGAGEYFSACLKADITALMVTAGVHRQWQGFHRALSKVFPYAIYYRLSGQVAVVIAVIDTRRDPNWIRKRLTE
jgi:ParE toxin of type II toxin-antitoxin system, parDE